MTAPNNEECILYELLVYSEWQQEPELSKLLKTGSGLPFKRIYQYLWTKGSVHDYISRFLQSHLPWHFAIGEHGKVVAILQESLLEIRSTKDEYSSVIGKAVVPKDAFSQWRKLQWSPDCSMLAVSHSSGLVSFYDLFGSNLFNIQPPQQQTESQNCDTKNALASILFIEPRIKSTKWSNEIILVDFDGNLRCYLVSPTEGFEENHTFLFGPHYSGCEGVSALAYHPSHNLLFVAGPTIVPSVESLKNHGSTVGLFAWRLLNDFPYYRFALPIDEKQAVLQAQRSLFKWMPSFGTKKKESLIFKMAISPDGKLLACLHSCGGFSLWHLPGLRLVRFWELHEQPDHNARNPLLSEKRRYRANDEFHPVDVNWWSDKAVIIARNSGSVSVCSISSLHNMLGASPEFLAGRPQVSALCSERGFLGLECETVLASKLKLLDDFQGEPETSIEEDDDDDDEDLGDVSILEKSTDLVKSAVYLVTDIEKFQPQRKRPKLIHKTYRLLGLKATTPEELYSRKIDNEEYGEALALAKAYHLDCDLVYQRQWRNSKVSIATIHDYLSKITKRSWVLRECVERIPETFAAAQELLEFGLLGTNLETLVAIAEGTDGGQFVLKTPEDEGFEDFEQLDEEAQKQKESKKTQDLLRKVHSHNLTEAQRDLLHYRQLLLQYLDRLSTYELILGGPHLADEQYDFTFYDLYRSAPAVLSTVQFARDGNWQAVRIMFTYHGKETLPHWLPILSNFPESMSPLNYRTLLPECDGVGEVFLWEQVELREQDWCEMNEFQKVPAEDESRFLYGNNPSLKQFHCEMSKLTAPMLSSWYLYRTQQIEEQSYMVDYALTFVKLARERNVAGLDNLYSQLLTLETLVYEVYQEDMHLGKLQKLSDPEICRLLMSRTSESTFVKDLQKLLMPFLIQCEKKCPGSRQQLLRGYLVDVSVKDLSLPLVLFKYQRVQREKCVIQSVEETLSLVLDCLYACQESNQLQKAFNILECLPERSFGPQNDVMSKLHDQLSELECDLNAAEIFEKNSISKPLFVIKESKKSASSAKPLLIKLARAVAKRMPPPTENQWNELLNDILDLQQKVFSGVDLDQCFEIYVATLLASGNKSVIRVAADILTCRKEDTSMKKLSYEQSVTLVLQAASEYFDSAGSLTDPAMGLAKACLHLILDNNEEIEEKLDLIASLQLLNDFGINMLPLQVRLCGDRMRLVEACVSKKPGAYRNSQRLLQLAHKLRVAGSDARQREGKVLLLIAETALQAKDYNFCAEKCQELVAKSHSVGWEVVQRLGQCNEYLNLEVRNNLLAFALLYCPADNIETLINTRCLIQAQLLHQKIESQVRSDIAETNLMEDEEFSDALTSPVVSEKKFPPSNLIDVVGDSTEVIRQKTYSLLKNVGDKNFWKNTFGWTREDTMDDSVLDEDLPFERQGFPAFYASLCPSCHLSNQDTCYNKFSLPDEGPPTLRMCRAMFRMAMLEQTASLERTVDNTDVLIQLSEYTLSEDSSLGLCQLMAIRDPLRGEECFRNLPHTEVSLQLAAYFYALQIYKAKQGRGVLSDDVYLYPPSKLIEDMSREAMAVPETERDGCMNLLLKYMNLLADFLQGKNLCELGCGIDLQRFTHDKEYQQDTILGLAMTTEEERFQLAVRLGARHEVPLGLIAATHASTLLTSDQIPITELTSRLANANLIKFLKMSPQLACDRLTQHVYPSIGGTDLQLLFVYFTLLNSVAEETNFNNLVPIEHAKLLKKLKAIQLDVDYKKLVEEPEDMLSVFYPVLSRDNINLIGKFVKGLPTSMNCSLQPGNLYCAWLKKEFFHLRETEKSSPIPTEKCLQQYQMCSSHFNKLSAKDVLSFVYDICFTEKSLDMMRIDCRKQIVDLAKRFCLDKSSQEFEENIGSEWKDMAKTFQQWWDHLETMTSLPLDDTTRSELGYFLKLLDLSRGESGPIRKLLQSAVLSSISLSSLQVLVKLLPPPFPSLPQLLEDLLNSSIADWKQEGGTLLPAVLRRMQENIDAGGVTCSADGAANVVWDKLEPLCGDVNLSPAIRLQVMQLLQSLHLSTSSSDMMLFHHTQAMVASVWPNVTVRETDLTSVEARSSLFRSLTEKTTTWQHIEALKNLLLRWPSASVIENIKDPWCQLLQKMVQFEGANAKNTANLLKSIFQKITFSEDCLKQVISGSEYLPDQTVPLLVCLLCDCHQLHLTAASILCRYHHVGSEPLSPELLSLVVKHGLASHVVSSPVYPMLVEYLLVNEDTSVGSVASQLRASGNLAEGGTLQLLAMGAPASLRVFSTALTLSNNTPVSDSILRAGSESQKTTP